MLFEISIVLGAVVLYLLIGTVIAAVIRRGLSTSERRELDDLIVVFVMIWPGILVSLPLMGLYRCISGSHRD